MGWGGKVIFIAASRGGEGGAFMRRHVVTLRGHACYY